MGNLLDTWRVPRSHGPSVPLLGALRAQSRIWMKSRLPEYECICIASSARGRRANRKRTNITPNRYGTKWLRIVPNLHRVRPS